jgi:hypothetical protein
MKLTKRKQFKFYRSYFDVYNELSQKDKLLFIDALLDKQFLNKDPENLSGIVKVVWTSLYHSIDTQVKGYESKTGNILNADIQRDSDPIQGGIKGGMQGPKLQEEEKEEEEEKVKIRINKEKEDFKNLLIQTINNKRQKYSIYKTDLIEFYEYWTEHGPKDRKMRFEKEKSFGIARRLDTWFKNKEKFNNNGKQTGQQKGATVEQLAQITAKNFAEDYPDKE